MPSTPTTVPGAVPADLPPGEARRLEALRSYAVLDTPPEQAFDDLTQIASVLCDTPIALVSLIDGQRQWFKSKVGVDVAETPRELSFCAHAILEPTRVFTVADTHEDARFAANPMVTAGPKMRFYAGAPLVSSDGQALGTLCVVDRKPRVLRPAQKDALRALARQVVSQLELRRTLVTATETGLTDALTGAANRRAFDARLTQEWNRLVRSEGVLSLALLDVDRFKLYNDNHGHLAGDEVLKQLVQVAQLHCRDCDFFARWGGEEFAVILPDTDEPGALQAAERLRTALQDSAWPHRPVTVSLGVATMHPSRSADPHGLVGQADLALYASKHLGRNRVTAYRPALDKR